MLEAAGEDTSIVNRTDRVYGLPALSWAAIKGHESVVQLLLSIPGIEINPKNRFGQTPLSFAAKHGHVGVVRLLLEKGNDGVNERDTAVKYGRTPLVWAIADPVNHVNISAPLGYACVENRLDVPWSLKRLDYQGIACYEDRICLGHTPIHYPAPMADYRKYLMDKKLYEAYWGPGSAREQTVDLLIENGADLTIDDQTGRGPLTWAVAGGSMRLIELLLARGAAINVPSRLSSALFQAAGNGDVDIVRFLLERGATTLPNGCGGSPLWVAAQNGHSTVVEMLLDQPVPKPPFRSRDATWEPLRDAARRGHRTIVKMLLDYHKRTWPCLPLGMEGLFWAAYGGWESIFRMLLDAGSQLEGHCEELEGAPMIIAAVMGRNTSILKQLLAMEKVDEHASDNHGQTALAWAKSLKNQEAVDLLRSRRGNVRPRNWWSSLPLESWPVSQ
ncbi:ankyrin repeat-containing domain protein [Aspergillus cavernicola]|uniref:Ankyrin repeat-containing domain protein n=1 Tax=Aspergillus cavernicola TaxID=176166 RepID=A0ABR4IVC0_9EURO